MIETFPFPAAGATADPTARPIVRYDSRGVVLIIGEAADAIAAASRLPASLRVVVLAPDAQRDTLDPPGARVFRGRAVSVAGHLGRFRVMAAGPEGPIDAAPFSANADGFFDIVLDLSTPALIATEVVPPGYHAPGGDAARLESALAEIPRQVGDVAKPRYVDYRAEICAHGHQGIVGCAACLEACPADAIAPAGDAVAVDFYRCLGCGTCTAVCPSGALTYAYAPPGDIRARIAALIEARRGRGEGAPLVLLHDADDPDAAAAFAPSDTVLPVAAPSLVSLGVATWLAALAGGATSVVVRVPGDATPTEARVLADEAGLARHILAALGGDPERCSLIAADAADLAAPAPAPWAETDLAALRAVEQRDALLLAVEALADAVPDAQDAVPLPADAAFGAIAVDGAACTLCLGCTKACPFEALAVAEGGAALEFVEASCVQCGLCRAVCPEDAITLVPRLLLSRDERSRPRRLHRGELARCATCGTPFMPQALLQAALRRLGGDSGLAGETARIIDICPKCRADAVMRDQFTINLGKEN